MGFSFTLLILQRRQTGARDDNELLTSITVLLDCYHPITLSELPVFRQNTLIHEV